MKKETLLFSIILLATILVCTTSLYAQTGDKLPPFKMLLTNGKTISTNDLKGDKPIVLIFFAPDCDHCKTLMEAFFKNVNSFKTVQVLLVTFKPLNDVANFEKRHQTYKYPNLIVASESQQLYLQQFYKLQNTPFTALYNKNKALIHSYRKDASIEDLINRIKGLK